MSDIDDIAAQAEALTEVYKAHANPPEALIGYLPRVWCKACRDARGGHCDQHTKIRNCPKCHNNISSAHIDIEFVGHADVTRILLEADPLWTWEPVAWSDTGEPLIVQRGSELRMWIRLTIHGHSRLGVGIVSTTKDEPEKQLIGDALRNAAMRFGIALALWSKSDRETAGEAAASAPRSAPEDAPAVEHHPEPPAAPMATQGQVDEIADLAAEMDETMKAAMRGWTEQHGLDLRRLALAEATQVITQMRLMLYGEISTDAEHFTEPADEPLPDDQEPF
jgi:hypothetical protein